MSWRIYARQCKYTQKKGETLLPFVRNFMPSVSEILPSVIKRFEGKARSFKFVFLWGNYAP